MHWDIFCRVIDNHGDIGVCWRLAVQLAARGDAVRLWVDEPSALAWMAPGGAAGVLVAHWTPEAAARAEPGDAVVEAFGCELDATFVTALAQAARTRGRQPAWLNLEYLSAEDFAERAHALPSPVATGPGAGLAKRFFYPGFTARTGGLLREDGLATRRAAFDRAGWLRRSGLAMPDGAQLASLFCYEPTALPALLGQLAAGPRHTRLLVTAGRAAAATRAAVSSQNSLQPAWNGPGLLSISYLPLLTQMGYDELLWACDLNFVRGEDSLVRALWAGNACVWQLYPQHDGAHRAKLHAFLDWLDAPASLRRWHGRWNDTGAPHEPLPALDAPLWHACVRAARARLLAQDDLATQLRRMALESR